MNRNDKPLWSWPERSGIYSLMGILNVTPDSFYDGGRHYQVSLTSEGKHIDLAVEHGLAMLKAGARYLDIGGESSRPGAEPVSLDEELNRVIPVIKQLSELAPEAVISIDTTKPQVAARALDSGARIINDISGLSNPEMREVAARYQAGVVIMHMRGTPKTMQTGDLSTPDIVKYVWSWLRDAAHQAVSSGISPSQIAIDIGIGFGKTVDQNISILKDLKRFTELGYPLLVGVSRKSMIGAITGAPTQHRLPGSVAAIVEARRRGGDIFRVHDVAESAQALAVSDAICRGSSTVWMGGDQC